MTLTSYGQIWCLFQFSPKTMRLISSKEPPDNGAIIGLSGGRAPASQQCGLYTRQSNLKFIIIFQLKIIFYIFYTCSLL